MLKNLLELCNRLLGPNGCPWDKKQTLFSLQKYLIEEAYELVQAIDYQNVDNIKEEEGDLLFILIFIAKLASIDFKEVVDLIEKKIIRRHPHIFGDIKLKSADEVKKQWDEIKKTESKTIEDKNNLINKHLPLLMRAQKIAKHLDSVDEDVEGLENCLVRDLFKIIIKAEKNNIQMEDAFRRYLMKLEKNAGDSSIT